MQISCSTVCSVHIPVEDTLRKISSFGFRNLELLAIREWAHIDAEKIAPEEIKDLCKKNNLNLTTLHAGQLNALNEGTLRESVSYIKLVIDLAKNLTVTKVVFTGGPRAQSTLDRYIKGLKELLKYIEGEDITLCIENHYQNQIETVEDMQRLVQEVDHSQIGLTADTGHFTSSGVSLNEVIEKIGEKVKHVHIKDHKGTQSVALGRGETDNEGFVKKLNQFGYQGELSMELEVEDKENIDTYLKEGYTYMENLLRLV
ncbi:sugar phosphate isomerase/epimerase [Candidatus Aerophobetes bacterium]|nr:sugar phosphate isomerase/epimerase [Candidatus Aerophobetes bacterium]